MRPGRSLQRNTWPPHGRPIGTCLESLEYAVWAANDWKGVPIGGSRRAGGKIALLPIVLVLETGSTVKHLRRWRRGVDVPSPLWTVNAIAVQVVAHGTRRHNEAIVGAVQAIGKIAYLPLIALAIG
jgi:hypothetical protein